MTTPVLVLMPVYNDWDVVPRLLERLDAALVPRGGPVHVLLVDDGSTSPPGRGLVAGGGLRAITSVSVVHLGRNVGHQRAIAIGLAHVNATAAGGARAVVVMDADGEDAGEDVPRLLEASEAAAGGLVFARRSRRSEGAVFRVLYRLYRWTYRLLTGGSLDFGNFSVVPTHLLPRLVLLSELWNHYPSAVTKARLPFTTIPIPRAARLGGRSQMSLTALILHGLGALSVHGDVIGVRALVTTLAASVVCLGGIATVVGIRFLTTLAIPGWASAVVGLLTAILLQTLLLSLVFVFVTLNSRNYSAVIPRRDYADYVVGEERVYP